MIKDIFIVEKLNAPNSAPVQSVVNDIRHWASRNDVDVLDDKSYIDSDTLVIAVGGDGTVIAAAKIAIVHDAAVIGFNTGKVGFLADFEAKRVYETLNAAFGNALKVEKRATVSVVIGDETFTAFNDIVISCAQSDCTLTYDLFVGEGYAGTHTANGVIISTPTGSTAYALAVGGAIIVPNLDVLEVVPTAAQTLTSRPLIIPGMPGATVKFAYTNDRPVSVRVDGQPVHTFTAKEGFEHYALDIRQSERKVNLLHHISWNHFDVLTEKLHWNK